MYLIFYSLAHIPTTYKPGISGVALNKPVVELIDAEPDPKGFAAVIEPFQTTKSYGGGDTGFGAGLNSVPPWFGVHSSYTIWVCWVMCDTRIYQLCWTGACSIYIYIYLFIFILFVLVLHVYAISICHLLKQFQSILCS